jgi:hypothetical protein
MYGNLFRCWVYRPSILSVMLISLAAGLVLPLCVTGVPGGQFPQRQQSPSTLPGSLPTTPGQPSVANPNIEPNVSVGPQLNRKQKDALVDDNFKKTKADVATLSKLVRSLQQAIDKSNANVLSLSILKQASKIEKLAKRIRSEAKGY